jgi:hypothetical protein
MADEEDAHGNENDYADDDFEKDDLVNIAPPRAPKHSKNSKMSRYTKDGSGVEKNSAAGHR